MAKILSWTLSAELPNKRLPCLLCVTPGFLAKASTMAAKRFSVLLSGSAIAFSLDLATRVIVNDNVLYHT